MHGVSRFLSRRDKHEKRWSKSGRNKSEPAPSDIYTILTNDDLKTTDKEEDKKIRALLQRLHSGGISKFSEKHAQYALSKHPADLDRAYELLMLGADSFDGIVRDFDPDVALLGAENRNMVTCYLDALLFSMFARLDSFDGMLFDNFDDEPRKHLVAVLRLWVNLLRSGRLITVDVVKHLQDALGKCGWEEATLVRQQDASEAFTFITGALELPLLTLKMDIYHTGREDKEDDHKFVNERLLEVAIPSNEETDKVVTLEACLETYFNNRIEVKRHLQRQNTLSSRQDTSSSAGPDHEKADILHIETIEVAESPIAATPPTPLTPVATARPLTGRRRADSIFSERYVGHGPARDRSAFDEKRLLAEMLDHSSGGRPRSASLLRKEVMMPAWQFFSLIPWYTDNVPQTDAQVAAHFSAKRPILGICLKRYSMLPDGTAQRLDTFIDIPLEIGLPHFISDDRMEEEGPLFGNFKLVLQSVVCHRGTSLNSGHYISLIRANVPPHYRSEAEGEKFVDSWLRFDDLAKERVVEVDMKQALKEESPYLLFYQVQPIDEELARGDPPTYDQSQSQIPTVDPSAETLSTTDGPSIDSSTAIEGVDAAIIKLHSASTEEPHGRNSMSSNHHSSVTFEEMESSFQAVSRGRTAPPTPDEQKGGFLSSRRNSTKWMGGGTKSRPTSQNGESRLSLTISRLTGRSNKDKPDSVDAADSEDVVILVNEVSDGAAEEKTKTSPVKLSTGKIGRSKSSKVKGKEKATSVSGKHSHRPDRECVVM